MARATRSSAADLKRKRSVEDMEKTSNDEHGPTKLARTASVEGRIDGLGALRVLEGEDRQGLLDRVYSSQSLSLRALLSTPTPLSQLTAAVFHLRPISSLPRASLSEAAAEQLRFCNLALSALSQLAPDTRDLDEPAALPAPDSAPPRPKPSYALVQRLPSGDYWSSVARLDSLPKNLHTAHAELVAVFPDPSSSSPHTSVPTLATYSTKPLSQKRPPPLAHRRLTTGAFLDYGLYSTFAPTFDQDGEVVGKNQLGQALWYREDKKRLRDALRREHLEGTGSIVDVTPAPPIQSLRQDESPPDLQLDALLPPEDVHAIKAALDTLELENSVQSLLDQNKRALERLEELQFNRLTKHPTSNAEEDSEEWEIAHAILDSLTVLASLRPQSSSSDLSPITPPPSVLHKLHRTLAVEPSPGWFGTLPASRTTALRDDSTVKVRPGAVTPAPVTNTPAAPAPAPISAPNTFGSYSYAYAPQQQPAYRPQQAAAYTPYKPGQATSFYQGYMPAGTQQQTYYSPQTYATGTTNQQPYGAATGQQPYAGGYSAWYGQYPGMQSGTGSGRGTPQPVTTTPTTVASTYGSFFNTTVAGTRTPAIANTVVANAAAAATLAQTTVPTLPAHVRTAMNGSPAR
ncbi:hypothetical protein GALMADRAFT_218354 [Galerina marginata CBS 339.88]|uniref:Uncharacterized protein n=1 Tax=Galerina marginata (strain CBS 339.88) TaxID=685588 RepID=A0A067TPW0_GALM3|nr:hypothetical protein GALMADRAFT_218354 [Galerina marginata CBS 339.88]